MDTDISHGPQWLSAIDQLYDAVGREQQLAQALDAFRQFFDARSASFFTVADARHPQTSHIGAAGMSDQMLVEYHAHYNVHDEWVNAAARRSDFGPGAVYRGSELVSRADLQRSYFARHFLARHQVSDVLAAVVEIGSGEGPTSFVSFHRHRGDRPYTTAHADLLRTLAPHMRQVLRLHRRLAPRLAVGATLHEIVRRMDLPLVFLAADGTIVDRNPAADAALAAAHPWLCERGGRLRLAGVSGWQDAGPVLQALGQDAAVHDLANDLRRCATLDLMPVPGAGTDVLAPHSAVAIGVLRPGARNKGLALRQLYALTPAEARVALQLTEGRSARGIAEVMGLSITTIRTHIASVLGKLGVARQAQLVSLVSTL